MEWEGWKLIAGNKIDHLLQEGFLLCPRPLLLIWSCLWSPVRDTFLRPTVNNLWHTGQQPGTVEKVWGVISGLWLPSKPLLLPAVWLRASHCTSLSLSRPSVRKASNWDSRPCFQVWPLPLTHCVALGKPCHWARPQFSSSVRWGYPQNSEC